MNNQPIIIKNTRNEFVVRWGNNKCYKMRLIGDKGFSFLPGREIFPSKDFFQGQQYVIVYSERSGGTRDFLEWWCNTFNQDEWILINGDNWDWDFCLKSPKLGHTNNKEEQLKDLIDTLGARDNINKSKILNNWVKRLSSPFTLIIRNPLSLGEERALQIATAIRVVAEEANNPHFNVLIASTSESVFRDLPDRSGLISLTYQYRILPFTMDEIILIASKGLRRSLHFTDEDKVLKRFYEYTGGQRLLVKYMLRRLEESASLSQPISVELVERAAREMRMLPPSQAKLWQEDLLAVLKHETELIHAMQSYVSGRTMGSARFPPPAQERSLFISGWIGLNKAGRWGITSLFHAQLARSVLDEVIKGGK